MTTDLNTDFDSRARETFELAAHQFLTLMLEPDPDDLLERSAEVMVAIIRLMVPDGKLVHYKGIAFSYNSDDGLMMGPSEWQEGS